MEEKTFKPVPDVECLKYHGTPEKPDIKIFVSHRIDLDSETIDNPLYIPVRCGAVYDETDTLFLGDDTGDNISRQRMSYCELTVIYWMWKNVKADYYGLSHYRRYLSFSEKKLSGAWQEQGFLDSMTTANLEKAGLLDEKKIRHRIEKYDMIIPVEFPVRDVLTPNGTGYHNTYDYVTRAWENLFIRKDDIDNMVNIIDTYFPEYSASTRAFMKGSTFRGFNIFILKEELFHSLCEFEFGVLEKIDSIIDYSYASDSRKRAPGYLGEVLYSIWCYHQTKNKSLKISEQQIIFFQDTSKEKPIPVSTDADNDVVTVCYPAKYDEIPLNGVSLQSVVNHINPSKRYRLIFLLKNMPENKFFVMEQRRQKEYLLKITAPYKNIETIFYDPKTGLGPLDAREYSALDMESEYYGILLPWILKNVKKVVYLTPYAILKTDIANLFEADFDGGAILAAKDLLAIGNVNGYDREIHKHLKKYVKMKDVHQYIDTSVMVMNLEELRSRYDVGYFYKTLTEKKRKNISVSHDAFNMLYEKEINILPLTWNRMNLSTPQLLQCIDFVESDVVKEFNNTKEPLLINFKNFPTPWQNTNSDFSYDFWSVARETPFYEQILSCQVMNLNLSLQDLQIRSGLYTPQTKMRRIYNRLCPPNSIRQKLIDSLFPKSSKRREALKNFIRVLQGDWPQKRDADEDYSEKIFSDEITDTDRVIVKKT